MIKSIAYTFGRMNPIHRGHELLITKMIKYSSKLNMDLHVFLSSKCDKNNPLTNEQKLLYFHECFPNITCSIDSTINDPYKITEKLIVDGYNDLHFFVGSDRVKEFDRMKKYFTKNNSDVSFDVVSAGERDSGRGISGISGSKMREYVQQNKLQKFIACCPKCLNTKYINQMFIDIRKTISENVSTIYD